MIDHAARPILLYNDECAVCRVVAAWVRGSAHSSATLDVRPIGDDPAALMRLHPGLNIWDAYAIVHLLMPDGSMQTGGAAVAEVLRRLPAMRGLAQIIDLHIGGFRPGVFAVNIAYTVLAEIRPLLGCASCGSSNPVIQSVGRLLAWFRRGRQADRRTAIPHFATATIYTPQKAL